MPNHITRYMIAKEASSLTTFDGLRLLPTVNSGQQCSTSIKILCITVIVNVYKTGNGLLLASMKNRNGHGSAGMKYFVALGAIPGFCSSMLSRSTNGSRISNNFQLNL